jgi:SAM-dependent methyltransferase
MERYEKLWVDPEGADYRMGVFARQKRDGSVPLVANPTIDEVRSALRINNAKTVLDVGCGWGRLMLELQSEFDVTGCDVSYDMLNRIPSGLKRFFLDIAKPIPEFVIVNYTEAWDVSFTRGVLHYLDGNVEQAAENLNKLTKTKIIIWEHDDVCEAIAKVQPSSKFDFRPIKRLDE